MRQPIQVAIYCFRQNDNEREFLLLHRIPSGGGFWQGVTGGVEDDEDCHTAASRELKEETGFTPASLEQVDYSYSFPVPHDMRKLYEQPVDMIDETVFVAEIDGQTEPVLDPIEHDAWKWCTYEVALQKLYWPGNRESLKHCREYLQTRK